MMNNVDNMDDKYYVYTTPHGQKVVVSYKDETKEYIESLCNLFFTEGVFVDDDSWYTGWQDIETSQRCTTELHMDSDFEQWILEKNPKFAKYYKEFPMHAPIKKMDPIVVVHNA